MSFSLTSWVRMKLSIESTSAFWSCISFTSAADDRPIAHHIPAAGDPRHLDLDFALGLDDQPVADIGRGEPVVPHDRGDALVHGVAGVLEIDQDHPQRAAAPALPKQRLAAGHGQGLRRSTASSCRCRPWPRCPTLPRAADAGRTATASAGISASLRNCVGLDHDAAVGRFGARDPGLELGLAVPVLEPPAHVLALRNVGVAHDLERHEISELRCQQGAALGALEAVGLAVVVLVDRRVAGAENPQPGGELGGPAQGAAGIGGGHEAQLGHGVGVALALANLHLDVGVGPQRRGQFGQAVGHLALGVGALHPADPILAVPMMLEEPAFAVRQVVAVHPQIGGAVDERVEPAPGERAGDRALVAVQIAVGAVGMPAVPGQSVAGSKPLPPA